MLIRNCIKSNGVLLLFSVLIYPQFNIWAINPSSGQNYIITYSPNQATTDINSLQESQRCPEVKYIDGLGRQMQIVNVGCTPSSNDIISYFEYDSIGRPSNTWLPFPSSTNGAFVDLTTKKSALLNFYEDEKPYCQNIYEESPLNRITKIYGAGANWQNANKGVVNQWLTNNQSDSMIVNNYTIQSDQSLIKHGTYNNSTLFVSEQIDEDGNKTWVFTDKSGHIILTRSYNEGAFYSTYYIYNDLDQLVYVLPPLASEALTANDVSWNSSTSTIALFGYYYHYDNFGNCIEKKLPGIASQYFVYDSSHHQVLAQDGNQRASNRWTFTKYDILGRVVMRGLIILSSSLDILVNQYKDLFIIETFNGDANNCGYSNNYFSDREKLIEIFYFDNYSYINSNWLPGNRTQYIAWQSSNALDYNYLNTSNSELSAKGLLTGSMSFLTTNQGSKKSTAYYYDKNGRIVQKNGTNHFNPLSNYSFGGDQYSYSYDFKGNILHIRHYFRCTYTADDYTEGQKFEYDHIGRLLKTKQYVNDELALVTTSTNTYNELGQLFTKTYGNNLETQTYKYNVRGWLKEINGSLFSEKLYYEENSIFNGNISKMSWMHLTGNIHELGWKQNTSRWKENWSTYTYSYDNLNRIKTAVGDNIGSFNETFTYDKHGNIVTTIRDGITMPGWESDGITPHHTVNTIDYLNYYYNGNMLTNINDNSNNNQIFTGGQDFKDSNTPVDYSYDDNGNMIYDLNKNIRTIKYNYLNLPDTIQIGSGHMMTSSYDANGDKFVVKRMTATGSLVTMPIGSTLMNNNVGYTVESTTNTMYDDNIISEEYNPNRILIADGILKRTNSMFETIPTFKYHYYLKDHLGSVRVVIDENGIVNQVNNYYPFGMESCESAENQSELTYQDYLFGGKEFNRKLELNMYDFGARNYDATIGRWLSVDPLVEKYYSISPYAYCGDNPVNRTDPDGRDWGDHKGEIIWINNVTSANDKDIQKGDKYLGRNVLVGTHNRDANLKEPINGARFDLYLESNHKGASATIYGNTVPADVKKYGTLKEGIYPAEAGHRSKYPNEKEILINGGRDLPTVNGNPHDPKGKPVEEQTLRGVFFHAGNTGRESLTTSSGRPISEGCQTGPNQAGSKNLYNDFMNHVPDDFSGYYYLRSGN